ncbi:MAG: hypothetical protein ACTSQE_06965 [Candidatus Heimdallarchaeaceae archaeon]
MKKFHLYIKTHCPAPDFELELSASNLENAIKRVMSMYQDLDEQIIKDNIEEIPEEMED